MGLYNFQYRFVEAIKSGHKRQTIRQTRAHPDFPGRMLHLYVGLRRRGAMLIKRVRCRLVEQITITERQNVLIDGHRLDDEQCELLARRDGFRDFDDFMNFWTGRLPFSGQIIHWF